MKDWSMNLPYWARLEGYELKGNQGTYDVLFLEKKDKIVKVFGYDETPNIMEIEEIIKENAVS